VLFGYLELLLKLSKLLKTVKWVKHKSGGVSGARHCGDIRSINQRRIAMERQHIPTSSSNACITLRCKLY
jgi:hypothetical protein